MEEAPAPKPRIIIKRVPAGHGDEHHGGAWKVAYADFVTAMMALFIVLWLMNTSQNVKEAVAGYFKDPAGSGKLAGTNQSGSGDRGDAITVSRDNMAQIKETLEKALKSAPNFGEIKDNVEITITPEGLRIELLETEKGIFFETGKPDPTETGASLLGRLAAELGSMPNLVVIEGHTDATPYAGAGPYTNWELSADRANRARQIMEAKGLHAGQVAQVRGFADQDLRSKSAPTDPTNRRISVIVRYQDKPGSAEKTGR